MDLPELRFTVWQFVRLMVHLEDAAKRTRQQNALYDDWAEVWSPLDQDLANLAESDADAYGEMMMDQDVVFDAPTPEQIATAQVTLEAVIADMDRAVKAGGDETHLESLKFERRELHKLARKLARRINGPDHLDA